MVPGRTRFWRIWFSGFPTSAFTAELPRRPNNSSFILYATSLRKERTRKRSLDYGVAELKLSVPACQNELPS